MMTEVMLVEGVTDIQLISYYLQNVYGWKYEKNNNLGIVPLDEHDHIESLSKGENQLVLCGVGGNGRFAHFVEQHRISSMIVERDITSLMVVTDSEIGVKNISFDYMDAYIIMITYFLRKMGETKTACKQFVTSYNQLVENLRNELPINICNQVVGTQHKTYMQALQKYISNS